MIPNWLVVIWTLAVAALVFCAGREFPRRARLAREGDAGYRRCRRAQSPGVTDTQGFYRVRDEAPLVPVIPAIRPVPAASAGGGVFTPGVWLPAEPGPAERTMSDALPIGNIRVAAAERHHRPEWSARRFPTPGADELDRMFTAWDAYLREAAP